MHAYLHEKYKDGKLCTYMRVHMYACIHKLNPYFWLTIAAVITHACQK